MSKNQENKFPEFSVTVNLHVLGCLMKVRSNLLSGWVRRTFYRFVPTVREGFPELKKYENTNEDRG